MAWRFAAGGAVNGPPTYFKGLCLFGCQDGWVYCLNASDGQRLGITDGAMVRVKSSAGSVETNARLTHEIMPGMWQLFSGKITTSIPQAKEVAESVDAFLRGA
jgi:hypothetical protein